MQDNETIVSTIIPKSLEGTQKKTNYNWKQIWTNLRCTKIQEDAIHICFLIIHEIYSVQKKLYDPTLLLRHCV